MDTRHQAADSGIDGAGEDSVKGEDAVHAGELTPDALSHVGEEGRHAGFADERIICRASTTVFNLAVFQGVASVLRALDHEFEP